MTVGQGRLARPEPSACFDSPGVAACGESAERGATARDTKKGHASPARRSPAQSPLPRRRRDTRVGVGRPCNVEAWAGDGGEMNPPPTRASCRQLSPKVARQLRLPRLGTRDLASPSHLGQRAAGAGAGKQADHRQPPDLPTPESAAQPDSPKRLRAPKIQRSQTPTGCGTGSRGGSRGAPGRAHPQLTALTTRTLPRIKHAVEPNLAVGLGSGGQRLGDGLAAQSCSIESRVGPQVGAGPGAIPARRGQCALSPDGASTGDLNLLPPALGFDPCSGDACVGQTVRRRAGARLARLQATRP